MSAQAQRIAHLRQQLADLNHWLDNWPERRRSRHVLRRKTATNRDRVEAILRDLGGLLIAGVSAP